MPGFDDVPRMPSSGWFVPSLAQTLPSRRGLCALQRKASTFLVGSSRRVASAWLKLANLRGARWLFHEFFSRASGMI